MNKDAPYVNNAVFWVEVGKISPNPYQPRREFDQAKLKDLAESIRMHPDQETLLRMMQDAGLEGCRYHNLTGGVVAVHRGFRY